MRRALWACATVVLLLGSMPAAHPQQLPWQVRTSPGDVNGPVVYEYPEQVELIAGKPQMVELHFRIRQGLHINSHAPHDKSLIRTELIVAEPPGVDVKSVTFPPGQNYASKAFPGHPLSVYSGELVLRAQVVARSTGDTMLRAALRYQACDTDSCFPPKKAPVNLNLEVTR